MKRPEIRPIATVVEKLGRPFQKENVLPDALVNFTEEYSSILKELIIESAESAFDDSVIDEHQHVLNCVDYLTQSGGTLSNHQKAQVWWCAEDLTIHLKKYQLDFVKANQDLLPLLGAIQRLVEPSFPKLSERAGREQLYLQWHRAQFELRNRISIPNDRSQLGISARAGAISEALTTPEPSLEQLSQANQAARELLSHITNTQDSVLLEVTDLLQKIEKTTRLKKQKGAKTEVQEEVDIYDLFTEYQTLFKERLATWFVQEIESAEKGSEPYKAASDAYVSARALYVFIALTKERGLNPFVDRRDRNQFIHSIESVFEYCENWGGPDFQAELFMLLAQIKETINREAERIHTETHGL